MRQECWERFPRHRLQNKPFVSDPGVHHSTCLMHAGIANPQWRGKGSRHSRRMRNPQFYVSDKWPTGCCTAPSWWLLIVDINCHSKCWKATAIWFCVRRLNFFAGFLYPCCVENCTWVANFGKHSYGQICQRWQLSVDRFRCIDTVGILYFF